MKVEVNLRKKQLFLILGVIIIIATSFIVYGYQSGGPPELFGHSAEEVQLIFQGENATLDEVVSDIDRRLNFLEDTVVIAEEFIGPTRYELQDPASYGLTGVPSEVNHPGIRRLDSFREIELGEVNTADDFDVTFIIRSASAAGFESHTRSLTIGLFAGGFPDDSNYYANVPKIAFESREYRNVQNKWLATASKASGQGSKTVMNTTVSRGTTSKWTKLRIARIDSETIGFYINDEQVAIIDSTNTPLIPMTIGIINHDVSRAVDLDFFRLIASNLVRNDFTCNPNPITTTGAVTNKPGYQQITVPASCLSGTGCIIKQEVYDAKGLNKSTKYALYKQEANNRWTSSYYSGVFMNGDASTSHVIPKYGSYISFRDDLKSGAYTEESPSFWTLGDSTATYGQRLFLCTYS